MAKEKTFLLVVLFLLHFLLWGSETENDSGWKDAKLNTASSINFLSTFEKEIILEINKLRSNPAKYANDYILPLQNKYKKKYLHYPGDFPLITKEGVKALNECVSELRKQKPLPIIYPVKGLCQAAADHVKDQSRSGKTGHVGRDRSKVRDRIERYGEWETRIAENIAYGGITPQQVVIYLLIDDGIHDRGHRKNFLHPDFKTVGVATGGHPHYVTMCVMDFAGLFRSF
ncbi:MAG TPA: CAP domain-containing protein [Prolixibacteraceae bacterium]|nr:CAP domain-containing protein [Prolixibacteraceae bacterium]